MANNTPSATLAKFDMRLGPDADGAALALYRQNIELLYRLEIAPDAAARFSSRAVTFQLPHAVLARVTSVAQRLARGPAEIARGGDQLVLYAQVKGEVDAVYAGRTRKLRPGDVAIIDYSREIESCASDFEIIYLMVAREHVPRLLREEPVHGTVFPGGSGTGQMLYRTLESLLETADGMTLAQADAAVDGVLAMAAGMLERTPAHESDPGYAFLARALALIDREIARPDLSPSLIQASLPLSRSALYRLFEPLGGVSATILQRRLDRAMKMLLTGTAVKPPVRAIARSVGFQSEDQFGRAFRRRFGITPHQFYDLVRRTDQAGLAAQAKRAGFANLQAWLDALPDTSDDAPGSARGS